MELKRPIVEEIVFPEMTQREGNQAQIVLERSKITL
jgi:hypothetical protein